MPASPGSTAALSQTQETRRPAHIRRGAQRPRRMCRKKGYQPWDLSPPSSWPPSRMQAVCGRLNPTHLWEENAGFLDLQRKKIKACFSIPTVLTMPCLTPTHNHMATCAHPRPHLHTHHESPRSLPCEIMCHPIHTHFLRPPVAARQ